MMINSMEERALGAGTHGGAQVNYTEFLGEKQPLNYGGREVPGVRLNKAETTAVAVTLLFVVLTLGFHWGRRSTPAQFSVRTAAAATAALPAASERGAPAAPASESAAVNINTATLEELCSLRGIGEALAQRIIDYREEHGPFACIEDITRVSGIGSGVFAEVRDRITVD